VVSKFQIPWTFSLSDKNLFIILSLKGGLLREDGSLQLDGRPISSNFALIDSASSLLTFSLTGLGAGIHQVLGLFQAEVGDFTDDS